MRQPRSGDSRANQKNDLDLGIAWRTLGKVLAAWNKDELGAPPVSLPSVSLIRSAVLFPQEPFKYSKRLTPRVKAARTLRAWAEFDLQMAESRRAQKAGEAQTILHRLGAAAPAENEPATQSK